MFTRKIIECLKEYGEASSHEVYAYVKNNTRHGATMQQIGNLLSKNKQIVKTGMTRIGRVGTLAVEESYRIATWKLKED